MSPITREEKAKLRDSINDLMEVLAETELEINEIPVNTLPPETDTSPETPYSIEKSFRTSLRPHSKKINITAIILGLATIIGGTIQILRELGVIK
jgi:hypothetical protein